MDKVYNHQNLEKQIYRLWEESGAFTPERQKGKEPFTIIMPPPNANNPLHIGHARFLSIGDILIRYHRMKGEPTLWLPGADHAGVETQFVFEKYLKEKGKSRFDYGRDELYQMIWEYVESNKHIMESQIRRLGASCDWTRNKFTLDPKIIKIVYETFKKLYDEGLVYRGERIVNYCPNCGTSFSELEIKHTEKDDKLYFIDYGLLKIATTRPETIFADVAVAVNPKDKRYKSLVGKKATVPLTNREVPIIEDVLVDENFGTGALKITPGHDAADFEIGQKHNLPIISVIDEAGKLTGTPEKYVGLKSLAAREQVVNDLKTAGKLVKIQKLHHSIGLCYKHNTPIEPVVSKQWFIKVKPLAKEVLEKIQKKKVIFAAKKYEKIAKHWLKNLKDWNISRQIVWGIKIPAFRCDKCLEWTITAGEKPEKCASCGHAKLTQDKDTFDTWFSSSQWPFATLKSTHPGDFEYFYPTSLMATAYDILPFWVIRMLMIGIYSTGDVPFKNVLMHGLVRDREGQKISKSKGNTINPIDMSDKYGADALRISLVWGTLVENDIALSEDNVRGQRNFANKIWNVARFVLMDKSKTDDRKKPTPRAKDEDDKKILKELKLATSKITKSLDKYKLSEAAETLYDFIWNRFANDYLESTKERREAAQPMLEYVLQQSLKLAHPFMPFVTEAIWQEFHYSPPLISSRWPK